MLSCEGGTQIWVGVYVNGCFQSYACDLCDDTLGGFYFVLYVFVLVLLVSFRYVVLWVVVHVNAQSIACYCQAVGFSRCLLLCSIGLFFMFKVLHAFGMLCWRGGRDWPPIPRRSCDPKRNTRAVDQHLQLGWNIWGHLLCANVNCSRLCRHI